MSRRIIKFRAWDGKEMIYDVGICPESGETKFRQENGNWSFRPNTGVPLMQFTGLHDKNGKEIWEGDIICWHHYTLHDILAKVEWHNGSFKQFPLENKGANWGDVTNLSGKLEVLGNIYENPELLK